MLSPPLRAIMVKVGILDLFRSPEHQMFKQMSRTAFSQRFVDAADLIPYHLADNRRLAVWNYNNLQAVVEPKFFHVKNFGTGGTDAESKAAKNGPNQIFPNCLHLTP